MFLVAPFTVLKSNWDRSLLNTWVTDEQKLKANLGPKMRSKYRGNDNEKIRLTNLDFCALYDDTNYGHIHYHIMAISLAAIMANFQPGHILAINMANVGIILLGIENSNNH